MKKGWREECRLKTCQSRRSRAFRGHESYSYDHTGWGLYPSSSIGEELKTVFLKSLRFAHPGSFADDLAFETFHLEIRFAYDPIIRRLDFRPRDSDSGRILRW